MPLMDADPNGLLSVYRLERRKALSFWASEAPHRPVPAFKFGFGIPPATIRGNPVIQSDLFSKFDGLVFTS